MSIGMSRLVASCVLVALTSGCAGESGSRPSGESTSTHPLPSLSTAPQDVPEQHDDGSTGSPPATRTLVLDDVALADALVVGTRVMALFARPSVKDTQWVKELAPHLTTGAAQTYKYVDPRNVPISKVTGRATLTPASVALVARVSVPTDDGVYLVILTRSEESPIWLADRIMPPEGSGDS